MTDPIEKVLLVTTVPALQSYSIGIINALFANHEIDCYACIFTSGNSRSTDEEVMVNFGIDTQYINKVLVQKLARNKVARILSGRLYLDRIVKFAKTHRIHQIHFISQDVMLSGHLAKFKEFKLYYTVHDLTAHPTKLGALQRLKHYYFRIRKDRQIIRSAQNLITNSIHQKEKLTGLFPAKNIFWHAMPSTVTPAVIKGDAKIREIAGLEKYVLFFGRMEPYKGADTLYEAFIKRKELANVKLVIAGQGNIYFDRRPECEQNIVFLNRYIADEEINDLFANALMLVLPYQSCTQSAVTSIGYHYGKPVVASDIDGLRDTVIHEKTGLLYQQGNMDSLVCSLCRLTLDVELFNNIQAYLLTETPFYDAQKMARQLALIYLQEI